MSIFRNPSLEERRARWAWTFLAVPIVFYVTIRFWPTADAFALSFQKWNLLKPREWVGLANYAELLGDGVHVVDPEVHERVRSCIACVLGEVYMGYPALKEHVQGELRSEPVLPGDLESQPSARTRTAEDRQ